jgi:hypothetical protein
MVFHDAGYHGVIPISPLKSSVVVVAMATSTQHISWKRKRE